MSKYVPTYYDKVCAVCGVAFVTSYKKGKYCGPICAKEGGRIRNMNNQRQKRMIEGAGAYRICIFVEKPSVRTVVFKNIAPVTVLEKLRPS